MVCTLPEYEVIKVAIYIDGSGLGNWSFRDFNHGNLAVSGTTGQALHLSWFLMNCNKIDFTLYTNNLPQELHGSSNIYAINVYDALKRAEEKRVSVFICNTSYHPELIEAIEHSSTDMILWAQNPPSPELANAIATHTSVKRMICVSKAQYDGFRHLSAFKKMKVIRSGVPYLSNTQHKTLTAEPVFAWMGAISETKGFHWLCKAWPIVRKALPQARLKVLGSYSLHQYNSGLGESRIADENLEKRYIHPYLGRDAESRRNNGVTLLGACTQRQMDDVLADVQIGIVNPNLEGSFETFCVSAVEFQQRGIPVVGGDAGGLRETILHNKTGIRISDSRNLGNTLVSMYADQQHLRQMSKLAEKFVSQNFTLDKMQSEWIQTIKEVFNHQPINPLPLNWSEADTRTRLKECVRIAKTFFGIRK